MVTVGLAFWSVLFKFFKDLRIASCLVVDAGQRLLEVLSAGDTALKSCLFIAFVFPRSLMAHATSLSVSFASTV